MYKDIEIGRYKCLCPRKNTDGIYVVGRRGERWIGMSHSKNLPYDHRFSRLYSEHIHRRGHLGVLSTASKIRTRFWIVKLLKMVKSIRYNCVICKKLDKLWESYQWTDESYLSPGLVRLSIHLDHSKFETK